MEAWVPSLAYHGIHRANRFLDRVGQRAEGITTNSHGFALQILAMLASPTEH
jgi:hypothetical protein